VEKFAKIGKKFFAESVFWERARVILQKSDRIIAKIVFLTRNSIFAKKICKHFRNACRYIPMG
jgi:hypothetical protein